MAYNTNYNLYVAGADRTEVLIELEDIVGYDPMEETCSWYEHNEHMLALAKRFPAAVLTLSGEGEEGGDLWRKYYKHGHEPIEARPKMIWPDPPAWACS